MKPASSRLTFFRQSSWMLFATLITGLMMYAVHKAAGKMDKAEYGVFGTLLQVLTQMTIPATGLQTILMRQTVTAMAANHRRELSRAVRLVLGGTFLIWLLMVVMALIFQRDLLVLWKISNPAALWLTVVWGLWSFWLPVFMGLLQGRQNFLWMGWCTIAGGVLRLAGVSFIVLVLGGQAAGAAVGVLLGMVASVLLGAWHTRDIWLGPGEPVHWRGWGKHVSGLTFGPGVIMFMMSLDMIVVQRFFPKDETGYYAAAGLIGRALVFLTAPMTWVMFPKIVESAVRSEKSNAMLLALGATALLGAAGSLFCTIFPKVPLLIIYDRTYVEYAWLIPWFGWCMLPLTLATVLVNNLLAREIYRAVPWLWAIALGYAVTLWHFHGTFLQVVQTLGLFGLLLLVVSLWFTLRGSRRRPPSPVPAVLSDG